MFKVPEWGNDIPDTKVNFGKTSQKHQKEKPATQLAPESPVKTVNGINKKHSAKKSTDKRKLKKIRQKNRETYQKLSNTGIQVQKPSGNGHKPGRFVLNPNKLESVENRPEKNTKLEKPRKQKNRKQKKVNIPNGTNSSNEILKAVKRKLDPPNETSKPVKHKLDPPNETSKTVKRKLDPPKKTSEPDQLELQNIDVDKADEIILNAKKKKLNDAFKDEVREDIMFSETPAEKPQNKVDPKKELIRKVLEGRNSNRRSVNISGNSLRERMLAKLQAAQFRYLNEKLYTSSGTEAQQLFKDDPAAFDTYHQGYQQQIKKWPVNPLDVIVKRIMRMPKTHTIADMGCGSASLTQRVPHKVRSFDLVAAAPGVEACDMAHTPLLSGSMDAVVYCLALMGTELAAYLAEGNRVLKTGGHLLIAEVESRFDKLEEFTHNVERLGFKLVRADQSHKVFFFLEFRKTQEAPKKAKHLAITLKPCLYKRR